ncbi:hypothetical protein M3Y98_01135300 [Aphelenchoides besseyi]|nr:hypothetical protein M3Y98_01135300 [Aphelenchoides besseyi]KAI6210629.1 hypothetical protein M3Y96_00348300 [Aphelenchoides besseyi]
MAAKMSLFRVNPRILLTSVRCSSQKPQELTEEMRSTVSRFVRDEMIGSGTITKFDQEVKVSFCVLVEILGILIPVPDANYQEDSRTRFGQHGYPERIRFVLNPLFSLLFRWSRVEFTCQVEHLRGVGLWRLGFGTFDCLSLYSFPGVAITLMLSDAAQMPILYAGSKTLKEKYVSSLCSKSHLAALAASESEAGSDLARAKLSAKDDGSGNYVLDGEKSWVTNCGVAKWAFVLAATDPDAKTGDRYTGFIVDRDARGVSVGECERTMGLKTLDTRSLILDHVKVPKENIVGKVGDGFPLIMRAFIRVRAVIAAVACGVQRRCLDEAAKYAAERTTFGHAIIEHEGVNFKLADMAQRLEASRLLAEQAAEKIEADVGDAAYYSSIAKCFSADSAFKAAADAVQIFGGNGYSSDFPVEKLLRDATSFKILGGANEIQRLVIERQLSKKFS